MEVNYICIYNCTYSMITHCDLSWAPCRQSRELACRWFIWELLPGTRGRKSRESERKERKSIQQYILELIITVGNWCSTHWRPIQRVSELYTQRGKVIWSLAPVPITGGWPVGGARCTSGLRVRECEGRGIGEAAWADTGHVLQEAAGSPPGTVVH